MKKISTLVILLSIMQEIHAQCDSAIFRYTASYMNDVSLIDSSNIVCVGGDGYIIKSVDGGKSWRNINSYQTSPLSAIQMIPGGIGYSVGSNKTIVKTEDLGESWFPIYAKTTTILQNTSDRYNDLYFFNKDTGFIVADHGALLSTNDGGRNWKNIALSDNVDLYSITFANDSLGFVCGNSADIYRTNNKGNSWTRITIPSFSFGQKLRKLKFLNSTTGFGAGDNDLLLKTSDGGLTWTKLNIVTGNNNYSDICFLDSLKGFIVGTQTGGVILQTSDGGNTWQLNTTLSGRNASFYSVDAGINKQKMMIVGGGGTNPSVFDGRTIISTTDAGASYNELSRNGRIQYADAYFLNDSTGFIGGDDGLILRTSDFGESWKPLHSIPAITPNYVVHEIFFLDTLTGFAATDHIVKTEDGGKTWTNTTIPGDYLTFTPLKIQFYNKLEGLVADGRFAYKTFDGGVTWTKVLTSNVFFTDLSVTPDGRCFIVGYGGEALRSNDKGNTWTKIDLHTTEYFTGTYFYDNQIGFIGTSDTTLYKTTDGGSSWTKINTIVRYLWMRSFRFLNPMVGYVVCNNLGGMTWIYKTNDGGLSWFFLRSENENTAGIVGTTRFLIAGNNGLILKTDNLSKPGIPGYISGPDKSCINTNSNYIVGEMQGVSFNWSLSEGGVSSFAGNTATVSWNQQGQHTLSVTASNACGTSDIRGFTTEVILFQPVITRLDSLLTVTEGDTYQWFRNNSSIPASEGGTSRTIKPRIPATYTAIVKSFSGCTVTTAQFNFVVALPLQLTNFKGTLNNNGTVDLSWITANETHSRLFFVERKNADGRYVAIDSVAALNTNLYMQLYYGRDASPMAGVNYYRLAITDMDSRITYSSAVAVIMNIDKQVLIYPNPVTSKTINITRGTESILKVVIYDLLSNVITSYNNINNEDVIKLNVGALKNGVYYVQVQTSQALTTQKILVNK